MRALVVMSREQRTADFADLDRAAFPDHPVAIRPAFSSMNYKDALAITGRSPIVRAFPMVLGIDLAGTVEEDRSGTFAPGDEVLATGFGLGEVHWGGYSEFARLKPEWLMRRPASLSAAESMAVGTAGLTAMLCILALEDHGVRPESGPVMVTGAAGGVGSIAVRLLSKAGFTVVAATGRPAEADFLKGLGASEILDRAGLSGEPPALGKERWAAAIDVAGGKVLANVVAGLRYGGAVAACGLVDSMKLAGTVAPFILRGVALLGVDSVMAPVALRRRAWERIAAGLDRADIDRAALGAVTTRHGLSAAKELAPSLLAGQVRGRIVLDLAA